MLARELAAKLMETPGATVEVCVKADEVPDEGGIDYMVERVAPVMGTENTDEPWVTIYLGDFVCDHG